MLCATAIAIGLALALLLSATYCSAYTRIELYEMAFTAKQNLALANVLDEFTILNQALPIHAEAVLLSGKRMMTLFQTHVFALQIYTPTHSIQPFTLPSNAMPIMAANVDSELKRLCQEKMRGNAKLRAAELLFLYKKSSLCLGKSAEELLAVEARSGRGTNAHTARLLLGVLRRDYAALLKLAYETNHAVAHLTLAQMFHTRGDMERCAIHLLQVAHATSHLVFDLYNGASATTTAPRHVRLSQLDGNAQLAADAAEMSRVASSAEEYREYLHHMQSLAHEIPTYYYDLGELYAAGMPELGIDADAVRAREMYQAALDFAETNQEAGMALSRLGAMEKDNATALALFERAHALGDPSALLGLAQFYLDGSGGLARNATRALELYLLAADAGYSEGHYRASKLLLHDKTLALRHLHLAAEAGHVPACVDVAEALMRREHKFKEAVPWLLRAVRTDWTDFLPYDAKQGLVQYLAGGRQGEEAALRIYGLASEMLWQPEALINQAYLMERAAEDLHQAFALYKRAALEYGMAEAYRKLGECYGSDALWPASVCGRQAGQVDLPQAAFWYRLASQFGDAESAWQTGIYRQQRVRGLLPPRNNEEEEDFARAIALDANAYWVVLLTRLCPWLFV